MTHITVPYRTVYAPRLEYSTLIERDVLLLLLLLLLLLSTRRCGQSGPTPGQIEFNEFVESFRLIKTEKKRDSGQISPSPSAAQEHSYEVNGTKATS